MHRWLYRVWNLAIEGDGEESSGDDANPAVIEAERDLHRRLHQTIQAVTHDLENFEFNTVISTLMEMTNALTRARAVGADKSEVFQEAVDVLLKLLAPITPHLAEELWALRGGEYSIHVQPWPEADLEAAAEEEITLIVQVNGKVRDKIQAPADIDEARARELALASESVQRHLHGEPRKVIYVPGRLVNIVA